MTGSTFRAAAAPARTIFRIAERDETAAVRPEEIERARTIVFETLKHFPEAYHAVARALAEAEERGP